MQFHSLITSITDFIIIFLSHLLSSNIKFYLK